MEQLDLGTFTGAHPTNKEFVARLQDWGFTRLRIEGVHLLFRAPGGGRLQVLRSQLGRADAQAVAKAARLAGVDVARFWDGPAAPAEDEVVEPTDSRRRAGQDRITSIVLAVHTSTNRPLGFDQVVRLCGGQVTRQQVRAASSKLCREGQLDRVRSGVYQWTGGVLAQRGASEQARSSAGGSRPGAAELFDQLFPRGVRMTSSLLKDFEQWTRLTAKLTRDADPS